MAPVPKKKHTRSRSDQRRKNASKVLKKPNLVVCSNCKKLRRPHRACPYCGHYK